MAYRRIDPKRIAVRPLAQRRSLLEIQRIAMDPHAPPPPLNPSQTAQVERLADRIRAAREVGASVMLTYGAHVIKNGCGPLLAALMRDGWLTHLATQGAGVIHDWEFAYQGRSSESVRDNAPAGRFGTWEETGQWIVDAALRGQQRDQGLGEALGVLMNEHAQDHSHRHYSATAAAAEHRVPLCVMPGIGYDIYCCHPAFTEDAGAALGRCATRDFHTLCEGVCGLTGGVYLSIGSAIMSPQVFEKALSIANNLRQQRVEPFVRDFHLAVVDIQDSGGWDWSQGEPPTDHPAYYLRFCKTFYRMAQGPAGEGDRGTLDYLQLDNRAMLANLVAALRASSSA